MLKVNIQNEKEQRASGIKNLEDGRSIIPSSVRPDGSIRCERRVRPGYIPPEDISVYKVLHHSQCIQKSDRICPGTQSNFPPGAIDFSNLNKDVKKQVKQKEKPQGLKKDYVKSSNLHTAESPMTDIEKRVRNLKKKIKETRKLEARAKNGEILLDDQIKKIESLDNLVETLKSLKVSST
ncbi:hypothetical protein PORY_002698 [Pneumocystis oryctolagi]|uniref:Uncharacterized protein n=1 Tax=Pneumocystis oryctolagi TaxID=42067 RepID=A0ACB7C8C0_9ASCO|nr:hypothetical protein PORY_002698 [Pneumocystis oryctolagi]